MLDRNEPITIQRLTIRDISIYKKDISEYVYESVKGANYEESYTREQAAEKTEELYAYAEADKAIALGAFDENKMVGFLWAYAYPFREDKNRLYVSILHVNAAYRNQRIGTKLIRTIEEIAKDCGYGGIYLHTEASNDGARRFYENMGYVKERIQYVKKAAVPNVNDSNWKKIPSGGVLMGTSEIIDRYRPQFVDLYFRNVKVHSYVEQFSMNDAEEKINKFRNYLEEEKAFLFYVLIGEIVGGFMWIHPVQYKNQERMYIHAASIDPGFRGKGIFEYGL